VVYKYTVGSSDSIIVTSFTKSGFLKSHFIELANKYHIVSSPGIKLLIMMGITIFMWLSIKLAIFFVTGLRLYKNNFEAFSLILSAIASFCLSFLPGFFIATKGKDSAGNLLFDASFDMDQFIRGSIFTLTIIVLIFALYLLYSYPNLLVRKISAVIFIIWIAVISVSFFSNGFEKAIPPKEDWYLAVRQDFLRTRPRLMAMMGNIYQSGQTATTAGIHPWFCTGVREDGEGFVFPKKAYERNVAFKSIFNRAIDIKKRKAIADSIRQLGVDCIVASPLSMYRINMAIDDSIISAIPGTKWMYKFKASHE